MKTNFFITLIFLSISICTYSQNENEEEYDWSNTETVDNEWDDYFMPGIGYKVYSPSNDSLGIFHGVMTQFVIYSRAKSRSSLKTGPARVKIYGDLSIIKSNKDNIRDIFYSNLGLNLSFEGNTDRKNFIPYFGIELGGMFQRNFKTFEFSPLAGIQLISTSKMIWSIQGGYQYTTKLFDEYSGYTINSTLNVLLWNN